MSVIIKTTRVEVSTTPGLQTITIDGFGATPKAALFIMSYAEIGEIARIHGGISFGACDTANQWTCGGFGLDAVNPTSTDRRGMTDKCIALMTSGGAVDGEASFDSFVEDGVIINWADAPSTIRLLTVVLFGGNDLSVSAGVTTSLGTTNDVAISTTGVGFTPDTLIMGSIGAEPFNDVPGAHLIFSVGFSVNDGSETQRSLGWTDKDGVSSPSTTVLNARLSTDSIINTVFDNGDHARIELTSYDADGFTVTTRDSSWNNSTPGYLALNYNGAAQAAAGTVDAHTVAETDSQTWAGMRPQFLMSLMSLVQSVDSIKVASDSEMFGIGVSDSTNSYANLIHSDDAVTPSNTQSRASSNFIQISTTGANDTAVATVTFTSSGYDLDYTDASAAYKMAHLVIETTATRSFGFAGLGGGFFFGPGT